MEVDRGLKMEGLPSKEKEKTFKKKSKKDKKEKKHKKTKKSKKLKKKSTRHSSSSSSSDSEGSANIWVEQVSETDSPKEEKKPNNLASSTTSMERDEWMTTPCMFACVTRDQLRAAKQPTEKQKAEEAAKYMLDRPGQTGRELNPYWAENGTGLPSEKPVEPESFTVGDQGVKWLRRALQRAKEQAAETGRSLEEVAAERWGSLQKLEELLSQAEGRKVSVGQRSSDDRRRDHQRNDRVGRRYDDRDKGSRRNDSFERHGFDRRHTSDSAKERNENRNYNSPYDKKKPHFERPSDEYTPCHKNNKSFDQDSYNDESEKPSVSRQDQDSSSSYRTSSRSVYAKSDDCSYDRYKHSMSDGRSRLGFRKPQENEEGVESSSDYRYGSGSRGSKTWRKKDATLKVATKNIENDETEKEKKRSESPPPCASSSESESEPLEEKNPPQVAEVLSDQQMNELAAKLVKAEIMGNEDLVAQLKRKLDDARQTRAANPKAIASSSKSNRKEPEVVILSRTDSKGFARPLQTKSAHPEPVGGRRKNQKAETHSAEGQRVRYFPDDDKYSLQDMFQKEKLTTVEDQNEMFSKLAGKDGRQEHDLDMDDIFSERARQKESDGKVEARERGRAIQEHKRKERMLDNCRWCFDGKELQRHLIVAVGAKSYICLPPYQSLTEGHCLIIPLHHTSCATQLDEDIWEEMQDFRKALVAMFSAEDEDCVFFESSMYLNKFPHMVLHCVPLPHETGDMAPIYFKKAILECETEWSTNKKLVDLSKKDVRHSIPKGLPYFAVDFGNEGGFAHVIEEEKYFPSNFAQEIIGGMLDLDHSIWRKPRNENFDKQRRKVLDFSKKWRDFDFTKKKNPAKRMKTGDSDSSTSSSP